MSRYQRLDNIPTVLCKAIVIVVVDYDDSKNQVKQSMTFN